MVYGGGFGGSATKLFVEWEESLGICYHLEEREVMEDVLHLLSLRRGKNWKSLDDYGRIGLDWEEMLT